jgi:hypothetical protein
VLDWKWNLRIADFGSSTAPEKDVFSFDLILYELIIEKRAIPKTINPHKVGLMRVREDLVLPQTKELILDCFLKDYRYRLLVSDIFNRIKEMRFKMMPAGQFSEFVKEIQAWEAANLTQQKFSTTEIAEFFNTIRE